MEANIKTVLRQAGEKGLPSLLIGGHAIILLGYIRTTADLDLLVPAAARSRWLDLLRDLGYRLYNGTEVFAQFEASEEGCAPVDLMFVEAATWDKLCANALKMDLAGEEVLLPRPEYLVALKIHAAASSSRGKPESDWADIQQIVQICGLDPEKDPFRQIILRYGGEDALARIRSFRDSTHRE